MAKKNSNFVTNAIADATAEPLPGQVEMSLTEQAMPAEVPAPQPAQRKGREPLPRINMAFSPELHDYIITMAQVTGQTITQFVNFVLQQYKDDHSELYLKAVEFRKSLQRKDYGK